MSTPKPSLPPILTQASDTAALTFSFLVTKDLCRLSRTCRSYRTMFRETMLKKDKASMLLYYIFSANPKKVKEFLSQYCTSDIEINSSKDIFFTMSKSSISTSVVLTKSFCKETYYCPLKKLTYIKRTWNDISPLEAAAWCGDIFLLRELLNYIPSSQHKLAISQLQGILDRKESAENGACFAPYRALLKAYEVYLDQSNILFESHQQYPPAKNVEELNWLWYKIWLCQRMLPMYGLQEYCDEKPFLSLSQEPKRICNLINNRPWVGYSLPFSSALIRGWQDRGPTCVFGGGGVGNRCSIDASAFNRFCDVRTRDIRSVIKLLKLCLPDNSDSIEPEDPVDKPRISI